MCSDDGLCPKVKQYIKTVYFFTISRKRSSDYCDIGDGTKTFKPVPCAHLGGFGELEQGLKEKRPIHGDLYGG